MYNTLAKTANYTIVTIKIIEANYIQVGEKPIEAIQANYKQKAN